MASDILDHTIYLKDYQAPEYQVDTVSLVISIGDDATEVTASLDIRPDANTRAGTPLRLHGVGLELVSLQVDDTRLVAGDYRMEGEELVIGNVPPRPFCLQSRVRIYPAENTALEGLYASGGMLCTQCEAEGFRKITFYPDRPDVMARFVTRIEADKVRYPVLLSNGNLIESGDLPGARHFVTWSDPFPKPAYLFAAVAGDLVCKTDQYRTASERLVDLRIYVEPHDLEKVDHAMASLKKAMAWDEQVYGREYDLDIFMIVAVSHFNMGAMENKGLNIFNTSCVLAHPDTTTDAGFQRVESVVAHEYFHNWSGNRVTCRDWFQLSLKEGFTVFRDQQFSADMLSASVQRIEDVGMLKSWQFPEDAGPLAHPVRPESFVEINNFYTATVYEKGAEIVRMLHTVLGAAQFRQGTDLYFSRHDGQAVTVEDFVRALGDASGQDLSPYLQWYRQPGTPELQASGTYDADQQRYRLTLVQTPPQVAGYPRGVHVPIPVRLALLGPDGNEMTVRLGETEASEHVVVLHAASAGFVFEGVRQPPVLSLLRDFSAPVLLRHEQPEAERLFLLEHDGNGVNRWLVAQDLLEAEILRLVTAGQGASVDADLLSRFCAMLPRTAKQDAALAARLMVLPSVKQLMDRVSATDPEALHLARQQLRKAIAGQLEQWLLALLAEPVPQTYTYDAAAIGRRALLNTALSWLADLDLRHHELAWDRFVSAGSMTDELAALTTLVHAGA
ncbi:MAG: aminopeptidase N, partial [Gammaproteobacteria bacterium]